MKLTISFFAALLFATALTFAQTPAGDFVAESANGGSIIVIKDYIGKASEVTIPSEIEGLPVVEIGDYAFSECVYLKTIALPDTVLKIGEGAFYGCASLQSVTLGNSMLKIEDWAFRSCAALQTVTFGNSLKEIGRYAFRDCTSLQGVSLPDSVETIGHSAFDEGTSLHGDTF